MKSYKEYNGLCCINQTDFSQQTTKHFEGALTQGSGYLHIRGSYEEGLAAAPQDEEYMRMPANVTIEKPRHPRSKFGTYIPGITGNHPLLNNETVNLPYPFFIQPAIDDEILDTDKCVISKHTRYLDMRDGVLYRCFQWKTNSGVTVNAEYKRFISRHNPNIVFWQGEFTADKPCLLRINDMIYNKVKTNGYSHFSIQKETPQYCEIITDTNDTVVITSKIYPEQSSFELCKDKPLTITKICCYSTSRDEHNPLIHYKTADEYVKEHSFDIDTEYTLSEKKWSELWNDSVIEIIGDDYSQYAVNFSVYHLLRCVGAEDSRVAICAKGFAGEAYFGHFFWDTEIYLLPFYLYTNPALAKPLAEFRINTLDGARSNAKKLGYAGARYPWESSVSGEEQCPNWQYADNEVHISADVVFGLWHYYSNTGDTDFLRNALPVFLETSRYWCQRVYRKKDGSVHLNGVMGPDEYICFCNDNTYTNFMVKKSLEITIEAVRIISDLCNSSPEVFDTNLTELSLFRDIADNIVIEKKDNGIYMQCKDFEDFEDIDFDSEWKDRSVMFGKCFSQERNYRSKALKQADVLMLPYLFESFMSEEELKNNFNYYFPVTTHDSSLSNIIHSILLAKLGDTEQAYELFRKSVDIDLDENTCGAAEGIHIANCGGIWQSIIFGFAGLGHSYENDVPTLSPKLPEAWKSISFPLYFKNEKYHAVITQTEYKLTKKIKKSQNR